MLFGFYFRMALLLVNKGTWTLWDFYFEKKRRRCICWRRRYIWCQLVVLWGGGEVAVVLVAKCKRQMAWAPWEDLRSFSCAVHAKVWRIARRHVNRWTGKLVTSGSAKCCNDPREVLEYFLSINDSTTFIITFVTPFIWICPLRRFVWDIEETEKLFLHGDIL